ncbi:hypothetical protein J5Y04_30900 [Kitasatospora sp. RG8]|uniref:hypothetical protein n=1 Tax=unclassified Kitasatospora TaxID=2633591 RepID=UPI001ADF0A6C|nr:hypothetical protein [Kitasatospora sp. RG8]MBP0453917.1 hypothetical protein [Kitasatospora sp. RG8]
MVTVADGPNGGRDVSGTVMAVVLAVIVLGLMLLGGTAKDPPGPSGCMASCDLH